MASYYDLDDGEVTVELKYTFSDDIEQSPTFLLRNLGLVKQKLKGCTAFDEQMVKVQTMLQAIAYHKAKPEPEPEPAPKPTFTKSPKWYEMRNAADQCIIDIAQYDFYQDWLSSNRDRGRYDFSYKDRLEAELNRLERMPFMTREMEKTFNNKVDEHTRQTRIDGPAIAKWNEQIERSRDANNTMLSSRGSCGKLGYHFNHYQDGLKLCQVTVDGSGIADDPVTGSSKHNSNDITIGRVCGVIYDF